MEEERKKLITDTLLTFMAPVVYTFGMFLNMVVLTRSVGAEGYGVWSQFHTTLAFISIFITLNLGYAMARFFAGDKGNSYLTSAFS